MAAQETRDLAGAVDSTDPQVGLAAVASLRNLVERLEELHVANARERGWSWQEIGARAGRLQAGGAPQARATQEVAGLMFERFTDDARQAVVLAQEEAVALHHGWIGTEHVLLGVLRADGDGARLLAGFGVDAAGVRDDVVRIVGRGEDDIDPDALATLGIDLDAVRERVERAFGPGALSRRRPLPARRRSATHVPFTARAKKALELTLREAHQPRRARPARRAPRARAAARGRRRRRADPDRARRDARRGARAGRRPRRA